MSFRLSICIFVPVAQIVHSLTQLLSDNGELSVCDRYHLHILNSVIELKDFVIDNKEKLDCLIILNDNVTIPPIINDFYEQGLILPSIIIEPDNVDLSKECLFSNTINIKDNSPEFDSLNHLYHTAEVRIRLRQLDNISKYIDKAIGQFLNLAPSCSILENPHTNHLSIHIEAKQNFLLLQQRRLSQKLKERLGYLGVYYNRNSSYFYYYLSEAEKKELIDQLKADYRNIILDYFNTESEVNQAIDQFVTQAFFADLSVSQILEIHMELMDEFAQQLKLEGRSEDILIDYRLALIDLIAHLCEMYRRSIPKEELPFEILFSVD